MIKFIYLGYYGYIISLTLDNCQCKIFIFRDFINIKQNSEVCLMYYSQNIAEKIKLTAKSNGITIKQLLEDVNLGFNTMSNMKTSMPKADNLAKIADYLNCSVDYLLGRTDNPDTQTNNTFSSTITNSSVGDNSANVTISSNKNNINNYKLSEISIEILKILENLNIREQSELLSVAVEIEARSLKNKK